jgi:hypothetical protein
MYAAVAERDPQGIPTRLALPGKLAGKQVGLYIGRDWVAGVGPGGHVTHDFRHGSSPRRDELAKLRPGTKIIAVTDRQGRVLALGALPKSKGKVGAPPPKQRSATLARSSDAHAHDPNELFYSGSLGRVVRVTR